MKRRLGITVLLTMFLSLTMTNIKAQTSDPQQGATAVYVGSSYKYMVDLHAGNSYAWTVTQTVGTSAAPTLTNAGTEEVTILWNSAGTFRIDVEETTAAPESCSTIKSFTVEVIGNTSTITFVASTENCADDIPAVTTNYTSDVTFTGGTAPWTIVYDIDGGADQTIVLTDVGGTSITFAKDFTNNPGGADQSQIITIKDAYDKYGLKPSNRLDIITNNITVIYTMHEVPNTSAIQHD
jgi:hypothetical protein